MVGSIRPLHPGFQHCSNFTEALRHFVENVKIEDLTEPEMIFPAYKRALTRDDGRPTLLVEYGDFYSEK